MKPRTYDEVMADQLEAIFSATRKLTFSKRVATKIVGGEKRLLNLIGSNKIHIANDDKPQAGKWQCSASDVLRNAKTPKIRKSRKQDSLTSR